MIIRIIHETIDQFILQFNIRSNWYSKVDIEIKMVSTQTRKSKA